MTKIRIQVRTDLARPHGYRIDELPEGPAARNCDCQIDLADLLGIRPGHRYEVVVVEIREEVTP